MFTCQCSDLLHLPRMTKKVIDGTAQFSFSTVGLNQICRHHYMLQHNIPLPMSLSFPESVHQSFDRPLVNSPTSHPHPIELYIQQPTYKLALHRIAFSFQHRSRFIFYTDGSV